jgi:acetoacetate decarboxylase
MNESEIKARAFAMPLTSPAFPPGPYRFVNREFFIITDRTDPAAPVVSLPVLEVLSGVHIQTDLTLGLGTVVHDYLAK